METSQDLFGGGRLQEDVENRPLSYRGNRGSGWSWRNVRIACSDGSADWRLDISTSIDLLVRLGFCRQNVFNIQSPHRRKVRISNWSSSKSSQRVKGVAAQLRELGLGQDLQSPQWRNVIVTSRIEDLTFGILPKKRKKRQKNKTKNKSPQKPIFSQSL